jgi:hypothetical protein
LEKVQNRFFLEVTGVGQRERARQRGEMAQTIYTHMNK